MSDGAHGHDGSSRTLTMTTGGITLLGVMLSVAVSVGMGIHGSWWLRVLVGVAVVLTLALVVKLGTRAGRGPLARLANWIIGYSSDDAL